MLTEFFKLAIRNLLKQKQTTLIGLIGLIIAFSVVLQIAQWCAFELSYDKDNLKAHRIYRFSVEESRPEDNFYKHSAYNYRAWTSKLTDFYSEIESLIELRPMLFTTVRNAKNIFRADNAFAIDSSIFNLFNFYFIEGSSKTSLQAQNTVIVSEKFARKLFPNQDALNKTLEINTGNINGFKQYSITGIYKDFPVNSHFHPEMLAYCDKKTVSRSDVAYTYILLKRGSTIDLIKNKEIQFLKKHVPEDEQKNIKIHYIRLTDIHLKSNLDNEIEANGENKQVRLFIFIGLGIFLIALINFINLLIGSYEKRSKYFNISITIGAKRKHHLLLLFLESFCIALTVCIVSMILFRPLSMLIGSTGVIKNVTSISDPTTIIISLVSFILIVVSGLFPILLIRSIPSTFFTNNVSTLLIRKTSFINNPLLVLQFTVSIVIVIISIMLNKQNKFLFSRNLGRENQDIVMLPREFPADGSQIMLLKEQLLKTPVVEDITMCMLRPGDRVKGYDRIEYADIPEKNKNQTITILPIGDNFFSFFNIPFVAGCEKKYVIGQEYGNYILNEAAIKKLGFESPQKAIGTAFKIGDMARETIHGGTIIGVVKDFNFSSLYNPIEPIIFFHKPSFQCQFFLKLSPGVRDKNLEQIKQVWDKVFPDFPFVYEFLVDRYNKEYEKEIITSRLIGWFTIICLLLSSIGLLGISSIIALQKTKEIGIRKVNGARTNEVLAMLNKNFVKWVAIAFLIACPIAWYAMCKWLENFAYKTEMSWWIFALAGLLAFAVALLTVSWQTLRAARRNPVESLRYE